MDQCSGAAGLSPEVAAPPGPAQPDTAIAVLYHEHALSMIRLAHIMLGSRAAAEDVVQDAFCGLYRRWDHLVSKDRALGYVRTSVLNGCRTILRQGRLTELTADFQPVAVSAEAAVLSAEERRQVVRALRLLPDRQRSVLVLGYYLDLPDRQIAADLGLAHSTVRSIRRRALASLERLLKERS